MPYKKDDWLKETIIKKYMSDEFDTFPYGPEGGILMAAL
jgi:hypothetical protein